MRRGGKQCAHFLVTDRARDPLVRGEFELRVSALQMRKGLGDRFARLAVRQDRRKPQVRMPGNEAQQFAGDIARATEDEGRYGSVHSATACTGTALSRPTLAITWSPSAAPSVIALKAATFICS